MAEHEPPVVGNAERLPAPHQLIRHTGSRNPIVVLEKQLVSARTPQPVGDRQDCRSAGLSFPELARHRRH
jgi:hypothetical protein